MTPSETEVLKKSESEGWTVFHVGAPDFLCLKLGKGDNIEAVAFREVKSNGDSVSTEQYQWGRALRFLGADYDVLRVDETSSETTTYEMPELLVALQLIKKHIEAVMTTNKFNGKPLTDPQPISRDSIVLELTKNSLFDNRRANRLIKELCMSGKIYELSPDMFVLSPEVAVEEISR